MFKQQRGAAGAAGNLRRRMRRCWLAQGSTMEHRRHENDNNRPTILPNDQQLVSPCRTERFGPRATGLFNRQRVPRATALVPWATGFAPRATGFVPRTT
eukprot:gene16013-biopygen8216